jgi:ElaB/YqjD/DUF883 family membrane-anchored ribosome-binding protein
MATAEKIEGNWNEIKGKLQKHWGQLSDKVLQNFHGVTNDLVGVIEKETGTKREDVEKYLNEISEQGKSMFSSAVETARDYTQQAAKTLGETSHQTMDQLRSGYAQTEDLIQNRPMGSVAVTFGVGVAVGVLVGLLLRSK